MVYFLHMKIRIAPRQIQKTILAPSMQQSIEVLLLPIQDLHASIEQELENNPLLEVAEREEEALVQTPDFKAIQKHLQKDEADHSLPYMNNSSDDDIPEENQTRMEIGLEELLLTQLRVELSDPVEIKIGEHIIGSLDEDGYLQATLEEIAQKANITDIVKIEKVLRIIQQFEPLGVASRDLKECLLLQVHVRCNGHSDFIHNIIQNHLDLLGKKKFLKIARNLKVPVDHVKEAAKIIASFEPKPARNYRSIQPNIYVTPDVYIRKNEDGQYYIDINSQSLPTLRISNFYKKMLNNPNLGSAEKEFIQDKLKSAVMFIKSIEQRHTTLRKITEFIMERQKEFFESGHMSMTPMTLKDVAESVDRNESTVSRAISHKYIDTPQGLYPLKFFFSQEACACDNTSISSTSIKEEVRQLILSEDRSSPLSDQHLQNIFTQRGMPVARRTISKYRQALNILPSHLRKN